jgi:uncharacterized protein YqeY
MSVKDDLQAALTAAMKARDEVSLTSLRQALAAIATAETAGKEAVSLGDDAVLGIVAAEVRKYHETADAFAGAGRAESAERERAYAAVLEAYLPAALSIDELQALIDAEVAAAAADGATGMKAMGRVVAAVRGTAGAGADGATIAAMVKATLGA